MRAPLVLLVLLGTLMATAANAQGYNQGMYESGPMGTPPYMSGAPYPYGQSYGSSAQQFQQFDTPQSYQPYQPGPPPAPPQIRSYVPAPPNYYGR